MLDAILRRLSGPAPVPATPDAGLALAALLVRLARADGDYAEAERHRIDQVLAAHLSLSPFAVADLRSRAETLESQSPDTVRFTRALKEAVPLEARAHLMEAMWSVVLADGARDADEDRLMRLIAGLLGLTDVESAQARQRASGAAR
ncbi:MAG: TerB family tellurite resistance protein [Paracoccaceae bacterium]|nr:MAG: TerB family tellurite resistance protein [Paracoccaceae bacterium]